MSAIIGAIVSILGSVAGAIAGRWASERLFREEGTVPTGETQTSQEQVQPTQGGGGMGIIDAIVALLTGLAPTVVQTWQQQQQAQLQQEQLRQQQQLEQLRLQQEQARLAAEKERQKTYIALGLLALGGILIVTVLRRRG